MKKILSFFVVAVLFLGGIGNVHAQTTEVVSVQNLLAQILSAVQRVVTKIESIDKKVDSVSRSINSSQKIISERDSVNGSKTIVTSTPISVLIERDLMSSSTSRIVFPNERNVEVNKIKFQAFGSDLKLNKITIGLQSASNTLWIPRNVAVNFGKFYLYDGFTLITSSTISFDENPKVVFSNLNIYLKKNVAKTLTIASDIKSSDLLQSGSIAAFNLFSTSSNDLQIFTPYGILPESMIRVNNNALSNFMLYHDTAPVVENLLQYRDGVGTANDIVGKYRVRNTAFPGQVSLTLDRLNIIAEMSGYYSSTSNVGSFRLFDQNNILIGTSNAIINGYQSNQANLNFDSSSPLWIDQTIPPGESKIFTIVADTRGIRSGVPVGSTVRLSTFIDGLRGYKDTSPKPPEYYWNFSDVFFHYTKNNFSFNGRASDSVPVLGEAISYR